MDVLAEFNDEDVNNGLNTHSSIDWASYDRYIYPAGRNMVVMNESGQICGRLEPMLIFDGPYRCNAVCSMHGSRCRRHRVWKASAGEPPNMPDRVLARWLVEGASHVSTVEHKALQRY